MVTLEHIDPKKSKFISGLENDYNEIIADESYNKSKNNRFVPYRVCEHPAPVTFGDVGEFLIEGEWVVCEFGGPEWWAESNRIGNAQVEAGRIGVRNQPREAKVLGGIRGAEWCRRQGVGIFGMSEEERSDAGKIGGAVTASRGYLGYGTENSIKTFDTCSKGGKKGGAVTRDSGKLRETSRLGGAVQGPRNKGMAWYHQFDEEGNIFRKRSKTPLPAPWIAGKGKSK